MGLLDDPFGKEEVRQLQKLLEEKTRKLSAAENAFRENHTARVKAERNLKALEERLANKDGRINALKRLLDESLADKGRQSGLLEQELSLLRKANAVLQGKLSRAEDLNTERLKKLQDREETVFAKAQQISQERHRIHLTENEIKSREKHWKEFIEPRLRRYEDHLNLDLRQENLSRAEAELEKRKKILDLRESSLATEDPGLMELKLREAKVNALNLSLLSRQRELSAKDAALTEREAELGARTEKIEKRARDLSELQKRAAKIDEMTEDLQRKREQLELDEKNQRQLHHSRLAGLETQKAELHTREQHLQQREKALRDQKNELAGLHSEVATLKRSNAELKQHIVTAADLLRVVANEKAAAQTALRKREDDYSRLHASHQTTIEKLRATEKSQTNSCSLFNPKILEWLTGDSIQVTAGIGSGQLGSSGHGPWDSGVMESVLKSLGYAMRPAPDKSLEVFVVGRSNWSEEEILDQIDSRAGLPIRIYSQEMFFSKLVTGRDPFDANDSDLLNAFAKDHPALQFLKSLSTPWPELSLEEAGGIEEVDSGDYGVSNSPLNLLGYRVGKTSPLTISERRKILTDCFNTADLPFSDDSDENYCRKWGRKGSDQRLYRIAVHLKSLADGRTGRDHRKPQARQDWISDSKWLKEKYAKQYGSRFSWPGI